MGTPPYKGFGIWAVGTNTWDALAAYSSSYTEIVGPSVVLNQWTHLVETFDGTNLKLYVDGALSASGTVTGYTLNTGGPLLIGATDYGSGPTEAFPGLIDDVAVYNRTLSATEVQLHYDSGRQ